jgi:hypothetical protein
MSRRDVFHDLQLNLTLAYATNVGQNQMNITPVLLQKEIQAALKASSLTRDQYTIIWGPSVYMDPSGFPANVTAVLQGTQDPDDYRVATSGTNFLALLEVGLEDLDVLPPLVPFQQYVSGCPSPALISPATDIGLQAVLTTPSSLNPGTGKLTDVLSALPDTARLTITGHSLGGTMAATLALLFHETLGKLAANLSCYAFAGATAGNAAFARYSDSVLQGKLTRVWNSLDIVPHAWNSSDLKQIDSLYHDIGTPDYIKKIVRDVVALDLGYTHCGTSHRLEGVQNEGHNYRKFTGQAGYQHIDAYRDLLKLG